MKLFIDSGNIKDIETLAAIGLSPDGKSMAYGISRSSRENELRITNIADGTNKVIAFGSQPVFSSDSRWVGYSIGVSEARSVPIATIARSWSSVRSTARPVFARSPATTASRWAVSRSRRLWRASRRCRSTGAQGFHSGSFALPR